MDYAHLYDIVQNSCFAAILVDSIKTSFLSAALLTTSDTSPFPAAAAAVPHSLPAASGTSYTRFTS